MAFSLSVLIILYVMLNIVDLVQTRTILKRDDIKEVNPIIKLSDKLAGFTGVVGCKSLLMVVVVLGVLASGNMIVLFALDGFYMWVVWSNHRLLSDEEDITDLAF
jgi:hypothetical protein